MAAWGRVGAGISLRGALVLLASITGLLPELAGAADAATVGAVVERNDLVRLALAMLAGFALAALIGWVLVRRMLAPVHAIAGAERESAERLAASEKLLRERIAKLPVAMLVYRADAKIESFNQRAASFMNITPENMGRVTCHTDEWYLVDAQRRRIPIDDYPVNRAIRTGRPVYEDLSGIVIANPDPNGAQPEPVSWGLCSAFPELDADGNVVRVVAVIADMTATMAAQQLVVAKEAAEAANRAKSMFLSRMSHDLRTPLIAVMGFSQLFQRDARLPEDVKQNAGHILAGGRQLLALVDEILDLGRLEMDALKLSLEPVVLADVLDECLALCQPIANASHVRLAADVSVRAARHVVQADRARLVQILMNLVSNGIKFNRAGGSVVVEVREDRRDPDHPAIEITVADTGRGIAPHDVPALFKPFSRPGPSATEVPGHGLGLAIARRLALAMAGDITVTSAPDEGSRFTVRLPGVTMPHIAPVAGEPLLVHGVIAAPAPDGELVLYVEDNPLNVALMRELFASRPGLRLVIAETGPEALALLDRMAPRLLLIDLGLPGMDGFDLLARVRTRVDGAGFTCWAVTADTATETARRARTAGFDEFITKPFSFESFLALLDGWARDRAVRGTEARDAAIV